MHGINNVKISELVKNFHLLYPKANFCFRDRKVRNWYCLEPAESSIDTFIFYLTLFSHVYPGIFCGFVWVWNLVADIEGGTQAKGVWE